MNTELTNNTCNLRQPLAHPCGYLIQGRNTTEKEKGAISKFTRLLCQKSLDNMMSGAIMVL